MHWDAYSIFSVLSGALLALAALCTCETHPRDRIRGFLGGAFFVAYGCYAASQTSGTFVFPVWIFVVPVGALVFLVVKAHERFGVEPTQDGPQRTQTTPTSRPSRGAR